MSDAYEDGLRMLSRRPLTRHEVLERLRARGHDEPDVLQAVARLTAIAVIDDAALARNWIASYAASRGRGRARAVAELVLRGVDETIASSAWNAAQEDDAIDEDALLTRAVRRRLGTPPKTASRGRLARVYNALLFEGFTPEHVEAALAPYGFERNEE